MGGGEAGLGQAQSRMLAKLWLAEPQSACLEAVYALKLPLVRKSRRVYTVSSAPPPLRMRQVSRHNVPFQSPVDTYTARPASLADVTFCRCVWGFPDLYRHPPHLHTPHRLQTIRSLL